MGSNLQIISARPSFPLKKSKNRGDIEEQSMGQILRNVKLLAKKCMPQMLLSLTCTEPRIFPKEKFSSATIKHIPMVN